MRSLFSMAFLLMLTGSGLAHAQSSGLEKYARCASKVSVLDSDEPAWSRACNGEDGGIVLECVHGDVHYLQKGTPLRREICDIPVGTYCTSEMFDAPDGVARGCHVATGYFYAWCTSGRQVAAPQGEELDVQYCEGPRAARAKPQPQRKDEAPSWGEIFASGASSLAQAVQRRSSAQSLVPTLASSNQAAQSTSTRAPLAPASCASYRTVSFDQFADARVEWRNNCSFPIEISWCWLPSGARTCDPDNMSHRLGPGETQRTVGPAGVRDPVAAFVVCDMSDSSKHCVPR